MSVIGFSAEEAKDLYADLSLLAYAERENFVSAFYEYSERIEYQFLHKVDPRDQVNADLARFIYRMYLANQMTYNLQYEHQKMEWRIDNPLTLDGGKAKRTINEVYRELSSWRYNLFTNAGRTFFCKEDMETLERLMNFCLVKIADPFNQNCGIPGEVD